MDAQVVNVASVPQRSPFRYPGGKSWLVPRVRHWLSAGKRPLLLVEPFAGGASVGLAATFEDLAHHVALIELDEDVIAVWTTILAGGAEWLAERIEGFTLSTESVQHVLVRTPDSRRERAFRTLLKNRVSHGGILAPGAGLIKAGEQGRGLGSRWYPATLARRIRDIAAHRDQVTAFYGDGLSALRSYAPRWDTVYFIDPPYTAGGKRAGKRLYTHWQLDHAELFRCVAALQGDFLMTYDNTEEVRVLATYHGFDTEPVAMRTTHHTQMTELLVGRCLEWVRTSRPVLERAG